VERRPGLTNPRVCLSRAVPPCSQADSSRFAERTHHMKNNARLTGLIEVKVLASHNIEQVVRREGAIKWRILMIAGDETFLLSEGRGEDPFICVVSTISQKLQSEEWMRRAAFAQVYFD